MKFNYIFIIILAAILPFSVELPVTNHLQINFPSEPLLALAVGMIVYKVYRKPGYFSRLFYGESLWILPLIFVYVISTLFSTNLLISFKFSIVNITGILVFYIWLKQLIRQKPEIFEDAILAFSISMLIVLIFSIFRLWHYHWNPVTIRGIFRPFYKDHTILGATCAFLTVYWIGIIWKSKFKWYTFLFSGVFLSFVILSNCRAAVLSLFFSGFVYVLLQNKTKLKYLSIVVLGIIIVIGFNFRYIKRGLEKNKAESHVVNSNYIDRLQSSANISTDVSNLERLNRWVAGIRMFLEKPVTGFGPGTYQFEYIPYQEPTFMNRLSVRDIKHIPVNSGGTAHSEYILVLSEMGIFGLIAMFLVIGLWIKIGFKNSSNDTILLAFTILSGYLFHAFFNNFLNTDKISFLFWGFAAWLTAAYEKQMDKTVNEHGK